MKISVVIGAACCLALGIAGIANAQAPSGGPSGADPASWSNTTAPIQEQMKQLGDYLDKAKAFNRRDVKNGPTKEETMKRAGELVAAIKLSCNPKDAQLIGLSNDNAGGKLYETSVYEVACTNGMGYFLTSHDRLKKEGAKPGPALATNVNALTCMSADMVHDDDVAKGLKSDFYCQLPDNGGGDLKLMGEKLLAVAGVKCKVSQFKWFGVKNDTKTEFTEAACDDGTGYLLQTALPGSDAAPSAMNCNDAARKGLECKMTPVVMPPTLATFRDYLAKTDVKCKVNDYDQMKVLGQESSRQRYVVEFKCAQQPRGLVAYIPLEGNSNPFETIDCVTAKKRGLACKLTTID